MTTIAWIGLGHMGQPMSKNMRSAGNTVRGYDIDETARQKAKSFGIDVVESIEQACAGADAVFTMVPAGPDVKKIMTAPDGVFAHVRKDALVVDCSTIGFAYARELHLAAQKAGVKFMEAPVSGGTEGARDGTLTFMIGGEAAYSERTKELLRPLGRYITYVGGPGEGQAAKIVNNLIMGVCVTVNSEATELARRLGLNPKALFEIVIRSSGDNWSFRLWNPAPGIVPESPASHEYQAGFKTWLLAKDLHLAIEAAKGVSATVATAEAAHDLLDKHARTGGADLDCSSLILWLAKQGQRGEPKVSVARGAN